MKKLLPGLIVASLIIALTPTAAFAHTADAPFVTDLIAGGGNDASQMDVGDVLVWNDGANLYVKYLITDGEWCLTETHLHVALSLAGVPQVKNGNPIPGQFAFEDEHNCVAGYEYTIPITWPVGTQLFIAAHGVVQTGGLDVLADSLPQDVNMAITWPGLGFGDPSYVDISISAGLPLDGMYDGYCLDTDHGFLDGPSKVYFNYSDISTYRIEHPENLDLVNWIINQGYLGQPAVCGSAYTTGDIQWAIWQLVEDSVPPSLYPGEWSPCRAQQILADALAYGEGFVPGCGDVMGLVLIPDTLYGRYQPILIWVPVPCPTSETAWAKGLDFPGDNWAMYFSYTVQ